MKQNIWKPFYNNISFSLTLCPWKISEIKKHYLQNASQLVVFFSVVSVLQWRYTMQPPMIFWKLFSCWGQEKQMLCASARAAQIRTRSTLNKRRPCTHYNFSSISPQYTVEQIKPDSCFIQCLYSEQSAVGFSSFLSKNDNVWK